MSMQEIYKKKIFLLFPNQIWKTSNFPDNKAIAVLEIVIWAGNSSVFVSPAKQKRDICIAFPASMLSSSSSSAAAA